MEKYITKDEYLQAKGVDLSIELQNDDNASNKVERFITEITDWCEDYLCEHYNNDKGLLVGWDNIASVQQEYFRKGVIEQIEYVLRNGWLTKDSGYNADTNTTINLESIALSPNAFAKFRVGGLANIRRTLRGF